MIRPPSPATRRRIGTALRTPHWGWLAGAGVGAAFTASARRPIRSGGLAAPLFVPSFFAGWLTNELVFHHLVWQSAASAAFIRAGALRHPAGWAAAGLTAAQWAAMGRIVTEVRGARELVESALVAGLGGDYRDALPDSEHDWDGVDLMKLVVPFRLTRDDVTRLPNRTYATVGQERLELDIIQPTDHDPRTDRRPCLLYIHGGGWMIRQRQYQGLPIANEFASRGWIVIRPDYRLSPRNAFPAHLIDVKRAIAWVRENADELGVDPDQIAIAGGSAGGHLAALAALTPDRTDLQPGFEKTDTSVFAAVPIYGVFDFMNRNGRRATQEMLFLEQAVFRTTRRKDPELFRLASPFDQVHADAPPFLVLHGTKDSIAPPEDAPEFAQLLRDAGVQKVVDISLPGAQHAFDIFPSWRSAVTLRGMARWLEHVRATRTAARA